MQPFNYEIPLRVKDLQDCSLQIEFITLRKYGWLWEGCGWVYYRQAL